MMSPDRKQMLSDLLQKDYRSLFGYVLSLVHHLDDAQDIVQDTCQTLWEKFDEYDPAQPFCPWAFGIARFKVLQHFERSQRCRTGFDAYAVTRLTDLWGQRPAERSQARLEALRSCLTKLDQQQRTLLQQCYDGGATVREVAEKLGRSAPSLHNTLNRIRTALLKCIERTVAAEAAQ
jgi:RNA polymerase sigma-70 factor (ECF subfamily)